MAKKTEGWFSRLLDSLARSSQVFVLSLLVACGIEVLVDWNQTLFEINVLRDQIRQKGTNYAGLVLRAGLEPLRARDRAALARLGAGILDDDDAVFVRITDARAQVIYEEPDQEFEREQAQLGRGPFRARYAYLMDRDLHGVITDLEGFKQRLQHSRYRDVPQIWTDAMNRVIARFVPPPPVRRAGIVYQDRLRDEQRRRDDKTTWALARIEGPDGALQGAVLVAFDMTRINGSIQTKYLKGLGMVLFFVALILVQNVLSRRDKLRLLDVEKRYALAKTVLGEALPRAPLARPELGLRVEGTIEQARGAVDGVVWDAAAGPGAVTVLIADPDGDGIDAAAIGLHILRAFRVRHGTATPGGTEPAPSPMELEAELVALGAATLDIPLTRPIGALLVRVEADGRFHGLLSAQMALALVEKDPAGRGGLRVTQVTGTPQAGEPPPGLIGPLATYTGVLPPGATLVCASAGADGRREPIFEGGGARVRSRGGPPAVGVLRLEEALRWARGEPPPLTSDVVVITIHRSEPAAPTPAPAA